jgi:hypothetical protein
MKGRSWWQPARSEEVVSIQNKLPMVKIGEIYKATWVISKKSFYTSVYTWEAIHTRRPSVEWW